MTRSRVPARAVLPAAVCLALAAGCPTVGGSGDVEDQIAVRTTVSAERPVVDGELVVTIPASGMRAGALPVAADLQVQVESNEGDSARPLALLVVDGQVAGPSLLSDPDPDALRRLESSPNDADRAELAAWIGSGAWAFQSAVSGFDQNTGGTTLSLALPCRPEAACEQRVPFRVELLESAVGSVEVDWEVTARITYSEGHAEVPPDDPPEGAAVTVDVVEASEVEARGVDGPPEVQVLDRGPTGSVPVRIDYPATAIGGTVRFVTGPSDRWSRGDLVIDGWSERGLVTGVGRGVFEVPLVASGCDGDRCQLHGTIGDASRPEAGPLRVVVDVRDGPALDAAPISDVEITFG